MNEDRDTRDINIDGDVTAGNANIGGVQNFYGTVHIGSPTENALTKRKPRIFISYARADDEPFVERLYHDLKDEFEVWWDRVSMPNRGLTFLQEIRDAIDWSDRLLLVAGPHAFTSPYVHDEWQYAYECYKGINIVLRLGDYPDIPELIRNFHGEDFRLDENYDKQIELLREKLRKPVAPVGKHHGVPAKPKPYLDRPDALDTLRELVIADVDKPTLISAEKRTTAVEGMGGIGKSVLATAFAHDRKVLFAFPDGIIWLTVGRKPNPYELYRTIGRSLGDDLSNYPDENAARQSAQNAMEDKKCLLILDDVWDVTIGRSFRDLISGTKVRLLITTRNLQINNELNANEYSLKLVDKTQAVNYLRIWAGDDPNLETVAEKLGYLFLALKLAGALMKENSLSGAEYLSMFERISDMAIADDNLEVSINLGLDAAFERYEDRRLLYHTFGIFQEDVPVPQQTILQFWSHLRPDVRPLDHLRTLTTLVNLGLVERDERKIITLHDLLHSYTHQNLGDRYVQTHQDFLDSYGITEWHQLPPDEPYLWQYIAYHLVETKQENILLDLLLDCDWLQAKLYASNSNEIINDCSYLAGEYHSIELLRHALRLSTHILDHSPEQLMSQLVGRLGRYDEFEDFITHAKNHETNRAGLQLLSPTLLPAGGTLIRTLIGHTNSVLYSALAGEHVISTSIDTTLKVWNWQTGQWIKTLEGHTKSVWGVAISGDFAVSASDDKTLRVWNWQTGESIRTLEGHEESVLSVVLSGKYAISTSKDKILKVWNWQTGKLIRSLVGHDGPIWGVAISGDYVVSASEDKTLKVWNWQTGKLIRSLVGHNGSVWRVVISNEYVISGSKDKTLKVWNWQTGEPIRTLEGHIRDVNTVAISEQHVVSGSDDRTLRVWNWQTGELIRTINGYTSYIRSVGLSGKFAITASSDRTLKVWDWQSEDISRTVEEHTDAVESVALSEKYIISTSSDRTMKIWDAQKNELLKTLMANIDVRGSVNVSGEYAITASDHGELIVWNLQKGVLLRRLSTYTNYVLSVALSDQFAVAGLENGILEVWNWQTGDLIRTFGKHDDAILCVKLSGAFAVSASADSTLRVWNWQTGDFIRILEGHEDWVQSVALLDNYAISGSGQPEYGTGDNTLRVWDWKTGELLRILEGHTYYIRSVSLYKSFVISASADNTLRIWNWRTGDIISTFHTDAPQFAVEISSDGKKVVSGGRDCKVHILHPNLALNRIMGTE